MSLTILLLAALLAQAEVSWALKMWRCDPAFKIHDPEMALKQRRFSLTLAKAGGPLKWSTVSADGGKAYDPGHSSFNPPTSTALRCPLSPCRAYRSSRKCRPLPTLTGSQSARCQKRSCGSRSTKTE